MSLRRLIPVTAVVLGGAAGFAMPAAATDDDVGWNPAVRVSDLAGSAVGGVAAVNASGDGVLGLTQVVSGVAAAEVATRSGFGDFGAPQQISSSADGEAWAVQVAIDTAGDALAIWLQGNGGHFDLVSAHRPAGGAWTAPAHVSGDIPGNETPVLRMNGAGQAVAAWIADVDHAHPLIVRGALYEGGAWTVQPDRASLVHGATLPNIEASIGPAGDAVIAWPDFSGPYKYYASVRPAGGAFGAAELVGNGGSNVDAIGTAITAAGDVVAVFRHFNGLQAYTGLAVRPAGGAFGAMSLLSVAGQDVGAPQVMLNDSGAGLITWVIELSGVYVAQAQSRSAGGDLGTPVTLSGPGEDVISVRGALDAQAKALVTWARAETTPAGTHYRLDARVAPAGAAFGPVTTLSPPGVSVVIGYPALAGGYGAVGWYTLDTQVVSAATFPTPPLPPAPAPTTTPPPAATPTPPPRPAPLPAPAPAPDPAAALPRCGGLRLFKIHLLVAGARVRSVLVTVRGHKQKLLTLRSRPVVQIDLRSFPRSTTTVRITVRLRSGRSLKGTRVYHPCTIKLPDHGFKL